MEHTDYLYTIEQTNNAVVLLNVDTKRLYYWNKIAKDIYHINGKHSSLEQIFREHTVPLEEMIQDLLISHSEATPVVYYDNIPTITASGEVQFVDFTIGYCTPDENVIYFEFHFRENQRETFARRMVDEDMNAIFLANFDEEMSIYYANERFYQIFSKSQDGFRTYYENSFVASLQGIERSHFLQELRKNFHEQKICKLDVEIANIHNISKWYSLEMQVVSLGKDVRKIKGFLLPIGHRVELMKELELRNQYLSAIQELTTGALFYVNPKSRKVKHHSEALKSLGFPLELEQFPVCLRSMLHPEDVDGFEQYVEEVMEGCGENYSLRYRTGTAAYSWAKVRMVPIQNDTGQVVELIGHIENMDAELQLLERATIDPLTNALNKDYVRETIETILCTAEINGEKKRRHALFFMDLDNFKTVNDTLGHQFGDFLLEEFGKRMATTIRSEDIFGRVGGDEFVFLIRNIPNMNILINKAQQLLETIYEPFDDGQTKHRMSGSVGVAVYPDHGTNYDELYQHADLALYRSKHRGKNMATIYKAEFS